MFFRILTVLALAAALAPAQRGGRGGGGNINNPRNDPFGNPNRGMNARGGNSQREARVKSRFDDLASQLNLDKDQKKSIRSAFDKASKEAEPIRQQMQKNNHDIFEAVRAGKGEEEVGAMVEKQAPLYAQMAALEMRAFARMFKELDEKQYKKAEEMMPRLAGFFQTKKWSSAE